MEVGPRVNGANPSGDGIDIEPQHLQVAAQFIKCPLSELLGLEEGCFEDAEAVLFGEPFSVHHRQGVGEEVMLRILNRAYLCHYERVALVLLAAVAAIAAEYPTIGGVVIAEPAGS